jgi:hypothetical protein
MWIAFALGILRFASLFVSIVGLEWLGNDRRDRTMGTTFSWGLDAGNGVTHISRQHGQSFMINEV